MLSTWLTRFLPGPRVMTPELRVKPPEDPSVAVILTLTKIVTLLDPDGPLLIPNFQVCVPPVLDIDSLWVQLNWVKSGGAIPCDLTLNETATLCCGSPGLVPVTLKTNRAFVVVVVVIVRVAVPEMVIVVGDSVALVMLVGDGVELIVPLFVNASVTVPVKPPTGVTVMLQLLELPEVTWTGCGVQAVSV
jgi:hypothetical protein